MKKGSVMKQVRKGAVELSVLFALVGVLVGLPVLTGDLETRDLDGEVRKELMEQGLAFVALSDGVVHYETSGPVDGDVLVLVHGNAAPAFSWDHTVGALTEAGFRVIRYDLYGFGYSDRPEVSYDRRLYERQLLELLDALAIDGPIHLAGTSQGGTIAVYFTAEHPHRVKKLAILASYINVLPMQRVMALIRTPGAGEYLADVALDRINRNYPKQVFADAGAIPDEFTRKYREQLSYRGFKRARLSNIREFIDDYSPWYEAVEAAGIPVLLTWGTADEVIRADSIANIRNAIPSAEYHTIEGGGHVVHYENPEPVNKMLVDFFLR